VLRTLAALVLAAGLACTATPAAAPTRVIPAGVSVGGVRVGGLSAEPARLRVQAAFARPVSVAYQGHLSTVTPRQVAAAISRDTAQRHRTARQVLAPEARQARRVPRAQVQPAGPRCTRDRRERGGA
jgi:nucleoid-associated protein YgaU